jgi:hypothetical protein
LETARREAKSRTLTSSGITRKRERMSNFLLAKDTSLV